MAFLVKILQNFSHSLCAAKGLDLNWKQLDFESTVNRPNETKSKHLLDGFFEIK